MGKITQLTCGFWLARNKEFRRCGNNADFQVLGNPVCEECASFMRMRGLPVYKMRQSTKKKKLAEMNSKPESEVVTA